jgi:hypothetical protein
MHSSMVEVHELVMQFVKTCYRPECYGNAREEVGVNHNETSSS